MQLEARHTPAGKAIIDLNSADLPDPIARAFGALADYVEKLEKKVDELTTPERLPDAILEPELDLAVLDGGEAVAEALRTANAARARRPDVPIVIAAETGGKSPGGIRVFDRWNETEELLLDVERLLSERVAGAATPIVRG